MQKFDGASTCKMCFLSCLGRESNPKLIKAREEFIKNNKEKMNTPKFAYLKSLQDSFKNYDKRQRKYESNSNKLQVGNYVTFQASKKGIFDKQFYESRPAIHKIAVVDATR